MVMFLAHIVLLTSLETSLGKKEEKGKKSETGVEQHVFDASKS